jgi:hypothetical protein
MDANNIVAIIDGTSGMTEVTYKDRGVKTVKSMDLDSFVGTLQAGAQVVGKMVNFHPLGLRVHAEAGNKVIVGYEYPERVVEHSAKNGDGNVTKFKTVYPWGLTWIEFNKVPDGLQHSLFYQFGLRGPILSLDTMMLCFPGSHIYADHHVCMGGIRVPVIKTVEATGGLPNLFYNGVNTYDLSDNRMKELRTPKGVINKPAQLYEYLKVKDGETPKPFPYECMRDGKTIRSFLEEKGYI